MGAANTRFLFYSQIYLVGLNAKERTSPPKEFSKAIEMASHFSQKTLSSISNTQIMKGVLILTLCLSSLFTMAQTPEALNEIIEQIGKPLAAGEVDVVLNRLVYPFKARGKSYTKATLKPAFSTVFVEGNGACLTSTDNYQVAMPGDDTRCLAVCVEDPETYASSVYSFRRIDGKWMLESMDFYAD